MVQSFAGSTTHCCILRSVLSDEDMAPETHKDTGESKIPISTKRLVDLYTHFSETSGLNIGKLNKELERACTQLGAPKKGNFDFKAPTVKAWKSKLEAEPLHTLQRPLIFAKACLLAFEVDVTAEQIFFQRPLSLNEIIEFGGLHLRSGQANSITDDGVCAHDLVISHLKLAVKPFPVLSPVGKRVGSLRLTPLRVTLEFSVDGLDVMPPSEDLEVVRGTARPLIVQLLEGDQASGGFLGQCSMERTNELNRFSVLRKFDASPEASAILKDITPLSIELGPQDEVTARVLIAEDDLEPTDFTSAESENWNSQKGKIFQRFFKLEMKSDERLVAVGKARPAQ